MIHTPIHFTLSICASALSEPVAVAEAVRSRGPSACPLLVPPGLSLQTLHLDTLLLPPPQSSWLESQSQSKSQSFLSDYVTLASNGKNTQAPTTSSHTYLLYMRIETEHGVPADRSLACHSPTTYLRQASGRPYLALLPLLRSHTRPPFRLFPSEASE